MHIKFSQVFLSTNAIEEKTILDGLKYNELDTPHMEKTEVVTGSN